MEDPKNKGEGVPVDEALSNHVYYYGGGFPTESAHELCKAESNANKIGESSVRDVKFLIRELVRNELRWGDLSPLNWKRQRFLKQSTLAVLILASVTTVAYWLIREPTSTLNIWVNGESLNVLRSYNDFAGTKIELAMRSYDGRWHLCPRTNDFAGCEKVLTPFEVAFDSRSKFVFGDNARVSWVENDRIGARDLKFADDQWWFEDDDSPEGWTDFDTYNQLVSDAREQQRHDAR